MAPIELPRQTVGCKSVDVNSVAGYAQVVNGNKTANTWTGWTQLIASTSKQYNLLSITLGFGFSAAVDYVWAVKFAVGGSGSEVEIIPGLMHYEPQPNRSMRNFLIPIRIPAGSRISAACRGDKGLFSTPNIKIQLHGFSTSPYDHVVDDVITSHGTTFSGAATTGTVVDPGATANTYGAPSVLESSTARDIKLATINIVGGQSTLNNCLWAMRLTKGIAITPPNVIDSVSFMSNSNDDQISPPVHNLLPVSPVPASTRLSGRAQASDVSSATARTFQVQVLGWG